MTKRVWYSLLAVAGTLGVLTGCGTTAATNANGQTSGQKVTLTFGFPGISTAPDVAGWIKGFEKLHPNVTIQLVMDGLSQDAYKTKLRLDGKTNSLPDIFWAASPNDVQPLVQDKAVVNLTPYLNQDQQWKGSFLDGALNQINGGVYAIPYNVALEGYIYNKALFDKYNLPIPSTWTQFVNDIKVFKQNGIVPIAYGGKDNWSIWQYNYFLVRYGFYDVEPQILNHQANFDSPELLKGMDKLAELHSIGAFSADASTTTYAQAGANFMAGKAAMLGDGTWDVPTLMKSQYASDFVFNWGPTFSDGVPTWQNVGVRGFQNTFAVGNDAKKNINIVLEFLKYISSSAGVKEQMSYGDLPPVKVDASQFKLSPFEQNLIQNLDDKNIKTIPQLDVTLPESFNAVYWNGLTSVALGYMTPQQALRSLDQFNSKNN